MFERWSSVFISAAVALAAGGCLQDTHHGTGDVAAARIGPEGGALSLGAARVGVPAGALDRTLVLTLAEATTASPDGAVGPAYDLGPEGTSFAIPVALTLPYRASAVPDPTHPELLAIAVVDGGHWLDLDDSTVDASARVVHATTTHFSRYAVVQRCGSPHRCPADSVCVDHRCVTAEVCTGGIDEDQDGAVDCQDTDCQPSEHCECGLPAAGSDAMPAPLCCYPVCGEHETLECLGDNICGYPCSCVPAPVEVCDNDIDDDGDGLVDCKDDDCARDPACACTPNQGMPCCYPTCADDQTLECLGANICGYPCSCVPTEVEVCDNGKDDDGDGVIDCQDPDCQASALCHCQPPGASAGFVPIQLCCYPVCDDGETLECLGDNICGYPCSCVAKARWYFTCGDPVCRGYQGGSGAPRCTIETAGDACGDVGATCDPKDECDRLLVCATSDPTQQVGGCPL